MLAEDLVFLIFLKSKAFRRSLRELMRVTFSAEKVTKNAIATSAVRPEGPDALRCSRQAGCAELAALRHAAHLLPPDPPLLGGYQAHPRQRQNQIQRPDLVN